MIGKTVSHYNILEKLGEGGMGEVYLAKDTRLHRKVALKFLPKHFTSDPDARARFEREARAAAALNHPNIVTVFDIGESDGQVYMAIELVDGETLADKIAGSVSGRPMAVKKIESIIRQLAEGLGKAHDAGIVHRDIKPSNIMIDRDGRVKILDFGLAKLKGSSKLTKEASTLGTVQYMSPEQARGEDVDGRSDIWSLGAVLYEMLAGRQPFAGEYDQHVIYSILNEEPEPLGSIRKNLPSWLERVVQKALRKDRDERYQDTDGIIEDLKSGDSKKVAGGKIRSSGMLKMAFAALFIIAATVIIMKVLPEDDSRRTAGPVFRQVTFTGSAIEPAISPDGQYFAYMSGFGTADGAIFVKDIASGSGVKIHDLLMAFQIEWAPDGSSVLYNSYQSEKNSGIYVLPRLGGTPRKLLNTPWYYTSWAPDGMRFAFSRVGTGDLFILDVGSGDTTVVDLEREVGEIEDIHWSPLGDDIILQGNDVEKIRLWIVRPDGREQSELLEIDQSEGNFIGNPRWSSNGEAIYFLKTGLRGRFISDLMKVRYDAGSRKLDGEPYVVLDNLYVVKDPGIGTAYSISNDGKQIIFEQKSNRMDLWMIKAEGEGEEIQWNTRRLTNSTKLKTRPCISPDGRTVVFGMGNDRSFDIYSMAIPENMDESLEEPSRLTYLESNSDLPVYSPNGREIAFYSIQDSVMRIYHMDAEGGTPRAYHKSRGSMMDQEITWAPGNRIIYRANKFINFRILDPATGDESDLIAKGMEAFAFNPCWSHSGDRVAIFMNRLKDGIQDMGLWVVSIPDGESIPLLDSVFWPIAWSDDDRWVYATCPPGAYGSDSENTTIFKVSSLDGHLVRHTVIPLPFRNSGTISITPDGRTIVFLHSETISDIWLVEDFDPEIE